MQLCTNRKKSKSKCGLGLYCRKGRQTASGRREEKVVKMIKEEATDPAEVSNRPPIDNEYAAVKAKNDWTTRHTEWKKTRRPQVS